MVFSLLLSFALSVSDIGLRPSKALFKSSQVRTRLHFDHGLGLGIDPLVVSTIHPLYAPQGRCSRAVPLPGRDFPLARVGGWFSMGVLGLVAPPIYLP